ncbi:MAG: transposase [Ruminococcaceae bacterium]|nr:transposase [Oscillospiraceae bacterium]
MTNGFTKGCNNKIKVIKRIAYGYKNSDTSEIAFYIYSLIKSKIKSSSCIITTA